MRDISSSLCWACLMSYISHGQNFEKKQLEEAEGAASGGGAVMLVLAEASAYGMVLVRDQRQYRAG